VYLVAAARRLLQMLRNVYEGGRGDVETIRMVEGATPHVALAVYLDGVQTVVGHHGAVARVGLEGAELLSVIAKESAPCGYPQKAALVLRYARHLLLQQALSDVPQTGATLIGCQRPHSYQQQYCQYYVYASVHGCKDTKKKGNHQTG